MSKETAYVEQMKALGIWDDAFRGAVHDLAVLEREQSRARKEWKATAADGEAPSMLDGLYQLILQQGRDIAKLREALGMTPKGLRRIRGELEAERRNRADEAPKVLDLVRARHASGA